MNSYIERRQEAERNIIKKIYKAAVSHFGERITYRAFHVRTKKQNVMDVRYIIIYVMVEKYKVHYMTIGNYFNRSTLTNRHNFARHAHLMIRDKLYGTNAEITQSVDEFMMKCEGFDNEYRHTLQEFHDLSIKWYHMRMYDEFEQITKEMETKVNSLPNLIQDLENNGYVVDRNPDIIYVPSGTEEENLPLEMKILRNKYGFMIQTQIPER